MKWIKVKDQLPPDDLRVLLRDMHGNIYIGDRDETGYYDDHNDELINIVSWGLLSDIQPVFEDAIITNDAWVTLIAKQGWLEK